MVEFHSNDPVGVLRVKVFFVPDQDKTVDEKINIMRM